MENKIFLSAFLLLYIAACFLVPIFVGRYFKTHKLQKSKQTYYATILILIVFLFASLFLNLMLNPINFLLMSLFMGLPVAVPIQYFYNQKYLINMDENTQLLSKIEEIGSNNPEE